MRARDQFSAGFKTTRPLALARDGNACIKCGHTRNLEVHHVNGYEDYALENLRTLCFPCHEIAPMGDAYFAWEQSGPDGWQACMDFIAARFPHIDRRGLRSVLESLDDYRWHMLIGKLRAARARKRAAGDWREGRKPFGARVGEAETLALMRRYRAEGRKFAEIAWELEAAGAQTRYGKPWREETIARILRREAL